MQLVDIYNIYNIYIRIYRDVGPVAHSETDGVCRAEVRAGGVPALTPPIKVGGGSRGAKPSLEGLPINLNIGTRLTMERGK